MRTAGAIVAAVAWSAALALLAWLWIRSPFIGAGPMFLTWSVPAVVLLVATRAWLRRAGVREVPTSTRFLAGLAVVWVAAAVLAWSGLGAEWALDGLILRRRALRWGGRALGWLPGLFGLAVCLGGLAASLEARYRLARGDVDRDEAP